MNLPAGDRPENRSALAGLYLQDSYVLAIAKQDSSVVFTMDLALAPEHSHYQPPRPGEYHCFRRARIKLVQARSARFVEESMRAFHDATGEVDYGTIDSWVVRGELTRISGDWGVLEVEGGTITVELDEHH